MADILDEGDRARMADLMAEFLADSYGDAIGDLLLDDSVLYVEFDDLQSWDADVADDYVDHPSSMSSLWTDALEAALDEIGIESVDASDVRVRVTDREGVMETVDVNELTADHLDRFVAVEGQLAKVTGINYRIVDACFVCQRCETLTYLPQPFSGFQEPHECDGCERQGPFQVDLSRSEVVDQRKLKLETPPSVRAQGAGDDITVFAFRDLVGYGGANGLADRAGERVVVLGRLSANSNDVGTGTKGEFEGYLVAESVVFVQRDLDDITVEETREEFERLASGAEGDPVELLKESITTSVFSTDQLDRVLEAAVAWLFNAYRIEGEGGDSFRGDLHMGVIGDPSTAKSTILSNLARIAPKSVYRSGGSISKVGLTAAATQEEFAGNTEWTLEPGVLARANGGHCIIDEVDEILDERSKAIHDALEGEQLVKVDKAGLSADLPTRTALCVSGNPKEGRFDPYAPVADQLDMDPALISRMDVLLPVTDELDREKDEKIADKIIDSYDDLSERHIAEQSDDDDADDESARPVDIQVFRDWVHYARETVYPRMTDESAAMLKDLYLDVRNLNDGYDGGTRDAPIPATARALEAGLRLSTAFARVELSETVEPEHVDRTRDILKASIGMNFDKEAAAFDADGSGLATPKTQRDRRKLVRQLIKQREAEFGGGGVPVDTVVEMAADEGADSDRVRETIEDMRRKGDLYEPGTGEVRTT